MEALTIAEARQNINFILNKQGYVLQEDKVLFLQSIKAISQEGFKPSVKHLFLLGDILHPTPAEKEKLKRILKDNVVLKTCNPLKTCWKTLTTGEQIKQRYRPTFKYIEEVFI